MGAPKRKFLHARRGQHFWVINYDIGSLREVVYIKCEDLHAEPRFYVFEDAIGPVKMKYKYAANYVFMSKLEALKELRHVWSETLQLVNRNYIQVCEDYKAEEEKVYGN